MTEHDPQAIGKRIKDLRRNAGMSQSDLAAAMHRSESWVSQVERGVQPVERLSMLQSLADALGVAVRDVRPEAEAVEPEAEPETSPASNDLDALRLALSGHPALGTLFEEGRQSQPLDTDELRARVEEVWDLAHASSFALLSERLAQLLPEIEAAVRHADAGQREGLHWLQARAYQVAAASFVRQDEPDAGWIAADRALQAAELAGKPLEVVASLFRMAHAFIRQQRTEQAERVAASAIEVLSPRCEALDCPPEELSLLGAMNLVLAVINAREGRRAQTHTHIESARSIAGRLGGDRNDFDTEFGPTNVELHAVATAVDLGDAGMALDVAEKVDPKGLSAERRSRFLLDVARAHAQRRHVGEAVSALLDAEKLAPEQIRSHHLARGAIRDLVQLSGNRVPKTLADLAERVAAG